MKMVLYILCLVFHNSVEYMNWASQFLSDADPIIVMGGMCISGSSHIDHRSKTVENESKIHMIPSICGSGRAGTLFPSIAASAALYKGKILFDKGTWYLSIAHLGVGCKLLPGWL